MDIEDFLPEFEDQKGQGSKQQFQEAYEDDDIDYMFPDLPEDPRFEFPSFKKKNQIQNAPYLANPTHPPINYSYSQANAQPQYSNLHAHPPGQPYQSTPQASYFGIPAAPSYPPLNQQGLTSVGNPHAALFSQFSQFQGQAGPGLHQEANQAFVDVFKFRQPSATAGSIFDQYTPVGKPQTPLFTGISKLVLALRQLLDATASNATLHKAAGHLLVVHKLTNADLLAIAGVNKRSLTTRALKPLLAKVLAKLFVALLAARLESGKKTEVWRLVGDAC